MKKKLLFLVLIVSSLLVMSCATDSSGSAKLMINECALVSKGATMPNGTFTLPNGTMVMPGTAIKEGSFVYASAYSKQEDTMVSMNEARNFCATYISQYISSAVNGASGATMSSSSGTKSGLSMETITSSVQSGMEACGYVYNEGVTYVLNRISLDNLNIPSDAKKALNNFSSAVNTTSGVLNSLKKLF